MRAAAGLAQLVERFSCKEDVVGSNPTPGSRAAGTRGCGSWSSRTRIRRRSGRPTASTSRGSWPLSSAPGTRSCWPPRASGAAAGARLASTRASTGRARAAARSHRPDVVWGHYLVPTGTIARRAAHAARRALRAHGARHRRRQRRALAAHPLGDAKAVAGACAVFAVSDDLGARLEAVAGPLGDRLHIVSAGVDTGRLHRRRRGGRGRRARLGRRDGPRVVSVGNYIPRKNLPRLIEAFAQARTAWGGGSLALVGRRRRSSAELEEIAAALGVADHVRFAGAVRAARGAALDARLRRRLPRLDRARASGWPPIEALACGRPVVVSRVVPVGRCRERGRHGRSLRRGGCRRDGRGARARRGARPGGGRALGGRAVLARRETARAVAVLEGCR